MDEVKHLLVIAYQLEAVLPLSLNTLKSFEGISIGYLHVFFPNFYRSNDYLTKKEDTFCKEKAFDKGY